MPTFYYHQKSMLHICNNQLYCSQNSYEKLYNKGKITELRLQIIELLKVYKLLTENMIYHLVNPNSEDLHADLNSLSEYGLIIKQFYECKCNNEIIKTPTFYSASPSLPLDIKTPKRRTPFIWTPDLRIEKAMAILAFNNFHFALCSSVPKKSIQAQIDYTIKDDIVDGRYKLKSSKYYLGYSHCMVIVVRDFSEQNTGIVEKLKKIVTFYSSNEEKIPWFILICENEPQCAHINKRLATDAVSKNVSVFFVLDTDIEWGENPFNVLQEYRFINDNMEIMSKTFKIEPWY